MIAAAVIRNPGVTIALATGSTGFVVAYALCRSSRSSKCTKTASEMMETFMADAGTNNIADRLASFEEFNAFGLHELAALNLHHGS